MLLWDPSSVAAQGEPAEPPSRATLGEVKRIGGADGTYRALIHPVSAVERGEVLYVADLGSRTVVGIDSAGHVALEIGGDGEGPGDFRAPSYIGAIGDTIWVSDFLLRRTTYFEPSGSLLKATAWSEFRRGTSGVRYGLLPLADGSRLGLPQPAMSPSPQRESGDVSLPILRWGFQGLDTLAMQTADGAVMVVRLEGGQVASARQPFPQFHPLVGFDPSGKSVVLVNVSDKGAHESTIEVTRLEPNGDTSGVTRVPYEPMRLTTATVDSAVASIVDAWTEGGPGAGRLPSRSSLAESVREAIVPPDYYPPVTDVLVGSDGTVWLRREGMSAPMVEWTVVGRDGERLWSVEMPRENRPISVAADHVWTVQRDELGLPYLVLEEIQLGDR